MTNNNKKPTATLLLIGNEILSGRTVDANLNYLARTLGEKGIPLLEARVVRDEEDAIVDALTQLREQAMYVFTTGGIGPTHDDITMACVAKVVGVELEINEQVAQNAKNIQGEKFTPASLKMCTFPAGAKLIQPPGFIYPGCQVENIFVLAGIPKVMQASVQHILPSLMPGKIMHSKSVDVFAGESRISAPFADIQDAYPQLELGSYPFRVDDEPGCSLVVRGTDASMVEEAHRAVLKMIDDNGWPVRQ